MKLHTRILALVMPGMLLGMKPQDIMNTLATKTAALKTQVQTAAHDALTRSMARPTELMKGAQQALTTGVQARYSAVRGAAQAVTAGAQSQKAQLMAFLVRNKAILAASGGALAGIAATLVLKYGYDTVARMLVELRLTQKIERIALATDYENKKSYTFTLDLANSSAPIHVCRQKARPEHIMRTLIPQSQEVALNKTAVAQTRGAHILEAVMLTGRALAQDPLRAMSPVTALASAAVSCKTRGVAQAYSAAVSALAATTAAYQWKTILTAEKERTDRETLILDVVRTIRAHAQQGAYTFGTYSVMFDFGAKTATIAYEPARALTHDSLVSDAEMQHVTTALIHHMQAAHRAPFGTVQRPQLPQ